MAIVIVVILLLLFLLLLLLFVRSEKRRVELFSRSTRDDDEVEVQHIISAGRWIHVHYVDLYIVWSSYVVKRQSS